MRAKFMSTFDKMLTNVEIYSDRGLPSAQRPDQLAKALHGVAKAAVNARHPGPQSTAEDPLEILAAGG